MFKMGSTQPLQTVLAFWGIGAHQGMPRNYFSNERMVCITSELFPQWVWGENSRIKCYSGITPAYSITYQKYRCTSQSKLPGLAYMCIQCLSDQRVRYDILGDLGWGRSMWSKRAVVNAYWLLLVALSLCRSSDYRICVYFKVDLLGLDWMGQDSWIMTFDWWV